MKQKGISIRLLDLSSPEWVRPEFIETVCVTDRSTSAEALLVLPRSIACEILQLALPYL